MGCKRPSEGVDIEELSFKHSRRIEPSNSINSISEGVSCCKPDQKIDNKGENEGVDCKLHSTEMLEKDIPTEFSTLVEKDLENSNPLSWVTSSSGEEDVDSGASAHLHVHSVHQEFNFPRRICVPLNIDVYSSSLDSSPRRHIPIGPNHQASIPALRGRKNGKEVEQKPYGYPLWSLEAGNDVDCQNVESLMGTCIIPMPDSNSSDKSDKVGIGRNDCGCLDAYSVRCVRQHIMEQRENLRKVLGNEKFVNLGLSVMGEEIAKKWSEEEELAFHEIVYSNPASLDKNFWKVLSASFPSRSKMELVSYYFNVFMLRKRAAQNRSKLLDIDSDDDDWHDGREHNANDTLVPEVDEDSESDSLLDQFDLLGHEEGTSEESDDNDDDDGDASGGGYYDDVGNDSGDVEDDGVIDHISKAFMSEIGECHKGDSVYKFSGSTNGGLGLQDDSCMSFECEPNMLDSCGPVDGGAALEASEIRSSNSKYFYSKPETASSEVDYMYFSPCDAKAWDARFHMGSAKSVDILPTWNMIEDVFTQDMEDKETKDDESH